MKDKAFTLIELAIVLIIMVSLIVVITGASSLKRSIEMKRLVGDVEKIRAATIKFKNIYDAYPGDFSKAQTVWPSCVDSSTYSSTCNGDGNGYVNATESSLGQTAEAVYMYEHLYHAGLLDRQYYGNNDTDSSYYEVVKANTYSREYNSSFIYYAIWPASSNATNYIDLRMSRVCANSSCGAGNDGKPLGGVLNVETAHYLDQKLDDESYDTGIIQAIIGIDFGAYSNSDCEYSVNMTVTTPYCQLKIDLTKNL